MARRALTPSSDMSSISRYARRNLPGTIFATGRLARRARLEDLEQQRFCTKIPLVKRHTRVGLVAITVADLACHTGAPVRQRRPGTVLMLLAPALRVAILLLPYFSAQNLPVSRTYRYRPGFPLAAIVSPALYSTSSNLFKVFSGAPCRSAPSGTLSPWTSNYGGACPFARFPGDNNCSASPCKLKQHIRRRCPDR